MKRTEAEIISIGDELLIGQVINTNASWMSQQLSLAGIAVKQVTTISDNREHILISLKEASERASIILITGGLGPTKDDITKVALCEYFGTELVFDQPTYERVVAMFKPRGFSVTEINRKQAEIPINCTPIANYNGTAPGMWFEKDNVIYVSMPGVPFEMKPMMSDYVLPELRKRFVNQAIVHKTILTQGVGESALAAKIEDWENSLPQNIKLAYLPQPGMVRLRLTAVGNDETSLNEQVAAEIKALIPLISDYIFGYDEDTLEEIVGKLLQEKGLTLATAESCTGGYLAHRITSVPGSSNYYIGSIISYSNDVKKAFLDVSDEDLIMHGAVSEAVVVQMAKSVRHNLHADYAIATSGVAGPDGGSAEKPVGTVWIAISGPDGTTAQKFLFGEGRDRNIHKATITGLNMLRKEILQKQK